MLELPAGLVVPAIQVLRQFIVSSFNALVYLPAVHCEQELASVKETNGSDMKEPAGQQPERAAPAESPVRDSHAPPHNVRVNPLL